MVPLAGVVVAAVVGVAVLRGPGQGADPSVRAGAGGEVEARADAGGSAAGGTPRPVEVSSDAPRVRDLNELVGSADVVVEAEVVSSAEGRWFGDDVGSGAILSRLVTLRVLDVIAGTPPASDSVLVEEEGWTADGSPLVVDGLAAAGVGDRGIWFLVDGGDPEVGAYLLVGAQGRYLIRDEGLAGASGGDALVAELSAMSREELAKAIASAHRSTGAGPGSRSEPEGSGG